MNFNRKLSYAIAAILSGSAADVVYPAAAADAEASTEAIQEITVTAQRRTENIQDVPISIRALTAETLTQLNVETFEDFVKYLPNVSTANNGPGQNEIFMRGLSAGAQASQGSGLTGLFPNVALYLDNQSGQLPNRSGGSAGHAVRCRRRGRRDPLYHERTEARRDRGERQGRLRSDRSRRSE